MRGLLICGTCPHGCRLDEGQTGVCHARRNSGGRIAPLAQGGLRPGRLESGVSFETFRAQVFNWHGRKVKRRGAAAEDDLMKLFE